MKRLIHYLAIYSVAFLMVLLPGITGLGQAPEGFNYHAILRDASGAVKANTAVSLQIEILKGCATGSDVFSETHTATTNDLGLVNLKIGSINTANFSDIDWSDGGTAKTESEFDANGNIILSIRFDWGKNRYQWIG